MSFDTRAANDGKSDEQCGATVGLLASAVVAALRYERRDGDTTVMLGGAMWFGVLQDDRAKRSA